MDVSVTMNELNPVFFATAGDDAYVRVYDRRCVECRTDLWAAWTDVVVE